MMNPTKHTKRYNVFSAILFLLLFIYLVLRVFKTEPVHDELATLFHYIDYNTIWGFDIVMDANNHLLNSVLGKVAYSIFGDHIWAIRLPNLFLFPLFFYSVYKISSYMKYEYLKIFFLIGMTCIPYILDYFSAARGYGMSMAFILFAIYHFMGIAQSYKASKMILIAVSLVLAVYANLNIIIILLLIFGYIGLQLLIESKKSKYYKQLISFITISFFSAISLIYVIIFAYKLKSGGALYYGNKDGLWKTTGSTLSDLVLQTTSVSIKYLLIFLIVGFIIFVFYSLKSKSGTLFLKSPAFLFIMLFLGSLTAIELMLQLLDVNYPEDRVGMQLIFLLIGAIAFTLNELKYFSWAGFVFILLPIVSYKHFNFVTSAFNPNERMELSDYLLFDKLQRNENVSSSTYTMLTYAYMVRKNNPTNFIVPEKIQRKALPTGVFNEDIASTQEGRYVSYSNEGYEIVSYNSRTREKILKRKAYYKWKHIDSLSREIPLMETASEYNDIISGDWKIPPTKRVKIIFKSTAHTPDLARDALAVVIDKQDKNLGNVYEYFMLNWAAGKNREFTFKRVVEFEPDLTEGLKLYLWNPNKFSYQLKDCRIDVYVVE